MRNLIALALFATTIPALAQDEDGSPPSEDSAAASRRRARAGGDEVIREIVRGYYLQSSIGSTVYAPYQGVQLGGQMALGIVLGSDFLDQERFSAAWEIEVAQALNNGPGSAIEVKAAGPVVQGDVHTIAATGAIEASLYLSRRLGLGGRFGGGVLYAPILVNRGRNGGPNVYDDFRAAWGGQNATFHNGTLPMILVGATLEYYTKLSHFSIGGNADLNVLMPAGVVSFRPVGYLKYTFN